MPPLVELPFVTAPSTGRPTRALLRTWERKDAPALARIADFPEIGRGLRDRFPSPYTLADAIDWIDWLVTNDGAKTDGWPSVLCIEYRGEPVGGIGFEPLDDIHRHGAECGYWLTPSAWGKGLASSALTVMVDYAFARTDLIRLYAGVFPWNVASVRVLEKAQFTYEATLRQALTKDGEHFDELIYARLR